MDNDLAVLRPFYLHPHCAKSRHRGQRILALEEATDPRGPLSQRTEHDGAVGNGFITWDSNLTRNRTPRH